MASGFELDHVPDLEKPVLVAGFSGWTDAAEVSTGTLGFFRQKLEAGRIGRLPPDRYHCLTVSRPVARIEGGLIEDITGPDNALYYVPAAGRAGPLLLFLGHEPDLDWLGFSDAFIDLCVRFKSELIVTVAGTFDDVPHTVTQRVSVVANRATALERLGQTRFVLADYHGPTSIHTFLANRALGAGIDVLGLWGRAPSYIQSRNAGVCLEMVRFVAGLLDLEVDLLDLESASVDLVAQVDELIEKNPKLGQYVRDLEKGLKGRSESLLSPEHRKVIPIEPFLKRSSPSTGDNSEG